MYAIYESEPAGPQGSYSDMPNNALLEYEVDTASPKQPLLGPGLSRQTPVEYTARRLYTL